MDNAVSVEAVIARAQPVLDVFSDAVVAYGCKPPFKPTIRVADTPGRRAMIKRRAVVLVPYEGPFCGVGRRGLLATGCRKLRNALEPLASSI
jgi:hypothetical protein